MALTALDPKTALLVIDLQKGLIGSTFNDPIRDLVARARALIDAFREQGLPARPAAPSSRHVMAGDFPRGSPTSSPSWANSPATSS